MRRISSRPAPPRPQPHLTDQARAEERLQASHGVQDEVHSNCKKKNFKSPITERCRSSYPAPSQGATGPGSRSGRRGSQGRAVGKRTRTRRKAATDLQSACPAEHRGLILIHLIRPEDAFRPEARSGPRQLALSVADLHDPLDQEAQELVPSAFSRSEWSQEAKRPSGQTAAARCQL